MKIKNKQLKAYRKLSDRSKLLQQSLWEYNEQRLGTRSAIDEEKTAYLIQDKSFKDRVIRLRKELEIPRLKLNDDVVEIEIGNSIEAESEWLNSQPRSVYDRLKQEVESLIVDFNLSHNFGDWLFSYILYRKPNFTPSFDWSLAHHVINNLDHIEEIILTSSEKNYVLEMFKAVASNNPKLTKKQIRQACIELKRTLAKSKKSTTRRYRTYKTAQKTKAMGRITKVFDFSLGKQGKYRIDKVTSTDLATDIFNDDSGKKASLVRKQKQRLKERRNKLLKQK